MADIVAALLAASIDKVFIVAGLAFTALAVTGAIARRISLGRFARTASAIAGVAFIGAGLYLNAPPGFKVVSAHIDTTQTIYGPGTCPVHIALQGVIRAQGTGSIVLRFKYNDGTHSEDTQLSFANDTVKILNLDWLVAKGFLNGFAELEITDPIKLSATSDPITVICGETSGAATTAIEPAPAVASDLLHGPVVAGPAPQSPQTISPPPTRAPIGGVATGTAATQGDWAGLWVEASPGAGQRPMRLNLAQAGNQVTFLGRAVPIRNGVVSIKEVQECAPQFQSPGFIYDNPGTTTISARLNGPSLLYAIDTTWNVQCDGHPPGKQHVEYHLTRANAP